MFNYLPYFVYRNVSVPLGEITENNCHLQPLFFFTEVSWRGDAIKKIQSVSYSLLIQGSFHVFGWSFPFNYLLHSVVLQFRQSFGDLILISSSGIPFGSLFLVFSIVLILFYLISAIYSCCFSFFNLKFNLSILMICECVLFRV